jgi:hypothetical protein
LWDIDYESWVKKSRSIANRELTPVELELYRGRFLPTLGLND